MPSGALLFQSVILGVLLGGLYALLAAGLTLYFGIMRVVMIAHSAFLILAAYLAWAFHRETGLDPLLSLAVTVPLFFGAGVAMQRLLLTRLRPATLTMMSVLLTFSIALVIEGMLGYVFTGTQRRIQLGYSGASLEFFGARVAVVKLIAFALAAAAMLALYLLMMRSRFGQALRATIQHKEAAQLIGIDTDRVAGYGFGLGLATAAVGGTALALDATVVVYEELPYWIHCVVGFGIIAAGGVYWLAWAVVLPKLGGYRLEREVVVGGIDGWERNVFVKKRRD